MMVLNNDTIIKLANELGFELVGFAEASVLEKEAENLQSWLANNFHADMNYMQRNFEKRKDVKEILPSAKSVISLGMNYYVPGNFSGDKTKGKISRYAWGTDYHLIIWKKLDKIVDEVKKIDPEFEAKTYVDTGPVMDKAWAVRAGLGWQGKHSNIINRNFGSWFFIANIICNYEFTYSFPIPDFCGSCTACIEACPTGAIVQDYVVDSNKCISYQTIENKNEIPEKFKRNFENWIYGCDICQDVCPWNNKFSQQTAEQQFFPGSGTKEIPLTEVIEMQQEEFSARFKNSPVKRTKLKGLKRNAEFILKP